MQIVKGKTEVDESMLNGRTSPIHKSVGDEVIGATVNQYGIIEVKVTSVGINSSLSERIRIIEETENTKFSIQEYANRVTRIFIKEGWYYAEFFRTIW